MKKILTTLALSLAFISPAFAQQATPESVKELLKITKTEQLIDQTYSQLEPMLNSLFEQDNMQNDGSIDSAQRKAFQNYNTKSIELMKKELSWQKMEPDFIKLYSEIYTQEEINGMIVFYKTPVGQSTIEKMPLVTNKTMQLMQTYMGKLIPKFAELAKEAQKEINK